MISSAGTGAGVGSASSATASAGRRTLSTSARRTVSFFMGTFSFFLGFPGDVSIVRAARMLRVWQIFAGGKSLGAVFPARGGMCLDRFKKREGMQNARRKGRAHEKSYFL